MRNLIPFQTFDLWREFDRLFEGRPTREARDHFLPPADVYETSAAYGIDVELPGMRKEDITISLNDGVLTVTGERKSEQNQKDREVVRCERCHGTFTRSWTLPKEADTDKINAAFDNGVLRLTIAKRPEVQPKQIEIKVH